MVDSNAGEGSSSNRSAKKRKIVPTGMECMDERINQLRTASINSGYNFASIIADLHKGHRATMKEELRGHREAMDRRRDKEEAEFRETMDRKKQEIEVRREKEKAEIREKQRLRGLEQEADFRYRLDRLHADRADLKAQQLELKQDRDEFKREVKETRRREKGFLVV